MKYLDLFSGISAATVAWRRLGWNCVGFSEIDKSASAVLKHHYPDIHNLGDVRKITEQQIASLGHIDIVVFGFPCQDLSIAGKRQGLHDDEGEVTRSGLFFDAMRIVRWSKARWAIAENVPGLFSSSEGRDFATVVGEMAGVGVDVPNGGWENSGFLAGSDGLVEWATLDAQYFRVPQRRRRLFFIRDIGDWRSRPPILLEPESLRGDIAPRRESGQVAPTIPARSLGGGGLGTDFDCDGGLVTGSQTARYGAASGQDLSANGMIVPICMATGQSSAEIGIGTTLNCNHEAPIVAHVAPPLTGNPYGDHESRKDLLVTHALRGEDFDASEDGTGRGTPLVPVAIQAGAMRENSDSGPDGVGVRTDGLAYTLEARSEVQAVAYRTAVDGCVYEEGDKVAPLTTSTDPNTTIITLAIRGRAGVPTLEVSEDGLANRRMVVAPASGVGAVAISENIRGEVVETDVAHCLQVGGGKPGQGYPATRIGMAVRRLTPEECESLMGQERGYTAVLRHGKPMADGPRYKMLGNSMVTHCMAWIGERILRARRIAEKEASK